MKTIKRVFRRATRVQLGSSKSANAQLHRWMQAHADPSVLADVEFGWEESSDLVQWEKTGLYPKRAAPTSDDLAGFWRKEPWIYKVDPAIKKFIRLVVKQPAP